MKITCLFTKFLNYAKFMQILNYYCEMLLILKFNVCNHSWYTCRHWCKVNYNIYSWNFNIIFQCLSAKQYIKYLLGFFFLEMSIKFANIFTGKLEKEFKVMIGLLCSTVLDCFFIQLYCIFDALCLIAPFSWPSRTKAARTAPILHNCSKDQPHRERRGSPHHGIPGRRGVGPPQGSSGNPIHYKLRWIKLQGNADRSLLPVHPKLPPRPDHTLRASSVRGTAIRVFQSEAFIDSSWTGQSPKCYSCAFRAGKHG